MKWKISYMKMRIQKVNKIVKKRVEKAKMWSNLLNNK